MSCVSGCGIIAPSHLHKVPIVEEVFSNVLINVVRSLPNTNTVFGQAILINKYVINYAFSRRDSLKVLHLL